MKRDTQRGLRSIGQRSRRRRWRETGLQKCWGVHRREWSAMWEAADSQRRWELTRGHVV